MHSTRHSGSISRSIPILTFWNFPGFTGIDVIIPRKSDIFAGTSTQTICIGPRNSNWANFHAFSTICTRFNVYSAPSFYTKLTSLYTAVERNYKANNRRGEIAEVSAFLAFCCYSAKINSYKQTGKEPATRTITNKNCILLLEVLVLPLLQMDMLWHEHNILSCEAYAGYDEYFTHINTECKSSFVGN